MASMLAVATMDPAIKEGRERGKEVIDHNGLANHPMTVAAMAAIVATDSMADSFARCLSQRPRFGFVG